jgi:hypothetical protein
MARREPPQWATPDRQAILANLFSVYGNRCLYGHWVCPDITHYIHLKPKTVYVSKPYQLPCKAPDGTIRKDENGKPMYLTLYKSVKSAEIEAIPLRLYDLKCQELIAEWKADDRAKRQAEQKMLHSLGEPRKPVRGQFNTIGQDIFYGSQPLFYREALGVSCITFKPIAKVRIASSFMRLYIEVDLSYALKGVSKNRRRKAFRYGRKLRQQTEYEIDRLCSQAVRHYLAHS